MLVRGRQARRSILVALVFVGFAGLPAAADTQTGSIGAAASATDFYQVICSDDGSGPPGSLSVQIQDSAPAAPPIVSAQVRVGSLLLNATDPTDGDGVAGPFVHVNGGSATTYDVLVDKTAAGAENYVLTFHCMTGPNGTGLHTGTAVVVRQNQ